MLRREDRLGNGRHPGEAVSREGFAAPGPARAEPSRTSGGTGEGEFWSVWSEERPSPGAPVAAEADDDRPPERSMRAAPALGSEPGPGQARLFLNLGRKDDATAEEVSQLFSAAGLDIPPEDIDVMNTHSYINVPAGDAERMCAAINGQERQSRILNCEPARPRRR